MWDVPRWIYLLFMVAPMNNLYCLLILEYYIRINTNNKTMKKGKLVARYSKKLGCLVEKTKALDLFLFHSCIRWEWIHFFINTLRNWILWINSRNQNFYIICRFIQQQAFKVIFRIANFIFTQMFQIEIRKIKIEEENCITEKVERIVMTLLLWSDIFCT